MSIKIFILLSCFLMFHWGHGQSGAAYKVRTIAFYNVENLFDTLNDTLIFDDDRTPEGKDHWTAERYDAKIEKISRVLAEIGKEVTGASPDIIGLCEVENQKVVEDLISHPNLRPQDYGIIHFDSPDERGIDVAMIYRKSAFIPNTFKSHRLLLFKEDGKRDYTRDQLVVSGFLDKEEMYFIVNHWPSRSGGEARSKPYRIAAARLNQKIIDSISKITQAPKIVGMGDLNDDPMDDSLKKILKTKSERDSLDVGSLFNPMERLFKKGVGSLAYRDTWNLFDQMFLTGNLISTDRTSYTFWKARVFNPSYLITQEGRYKGYPFRTYAGGSYSGGFSDHFPVYIFLVKKLDGSSSKE